MFLLLVGWISWPMLVPLVVSTTAHQRDNAVYMAERGAALHLPQTALSADSLADTLQGLRRDQLLQMATQARGLARRQSAAAVADAIEQLVNLQKKKRAST